MVLTIHGEPMERNDTCSTIAGVHVYYVHTMEHTTEIEEQYSTYHSEDRLLRTVAHQHCLHNGQEIDNDLIHGLYIQHLL